VFKKRAKYIAEFKSEAVRQISKKEHSATEVCSRLGMSVDLLYNGFEISKDRVCKPTEAIKAM
jgi:transposase-like protein